MKVQRKEVNYNNNCCELLIASYVMDVTSFNSCSNPVRECISFLWLLKQLDGLKQQKCILSSSGGQKSKIRLLPGLPSLRRLWRGCFLVSSSFWWLQASLACGLRSCSLLPLSSRRLLLCVSDLPQPFSYKNTWPLDLRFTQLIQDYLILRCFV